MICKVHYIQGILNGDAQAGLCAAFLTFRQWRETGAEQLGPVNVSRDDAIATICTIVY